MKYFLITFYLFSFWQISAQEKFQTITSFGGNIGVHFSKVSFSPSISQSYSFGNVAGLVFIHVSEPFLGIQVELNYSQKGWMENLELPNSYSRRFEYIELPLLTHIELGDKNNKILLNLGPSFSYLLSTKEFIDLKDEELTKIYYNKNIDNKFDFGLCIGLGISKNTSFGIFQIEARYNHSINSLFSKYNNKIFSNSQNTVIGLKLNYLYLIK